MPFQNSYLTCIKKIRELEKVGLGVGELHVANGVEWAIEQVSSLDKFDGKIFTPEVVEKIFRDAYDNYLDADESSYAVNPDWSGLKNTLIHYFNIVSGADDEDMVFDILHDECVLDTDNLSDILDNVNEDYDDIMKRLKEGK